MLETSNKESQESRQGVQQGNGEEKRDTLQAHRRTPALWALLAPRLAPGGVWTHGRFAEAMVWVAECLQGGRFTLTHSLPQSLFKPSAGLSVLEAT